jgi:hypothetical protein
MFKRPFIVLAAITMLAFQSCKIMYTPNMQNVPLFQERNEIRATIGVSDFQGAYAITNHMGVMLNGQYKNPKWKLTTGNREYNYKSNKSLVEAGTGYFMGLGESGVFEVWGGGGVGKVTFDRSYSDSNSTTMTDQYSANTSRFFIQPSIGLTTKNFDFAFSMRFAGLKFSNIDTTGYTPDGLLIEDLSNLDKPLYSFFEPAITLRAGKEYVKFHLQAIWSIKMNEDRLNYIPFTVNFGAHINIAPRFKK